jgi:hypothetical protein
MDGAVNPDDVSTWPRELLDVLMPHVTGVDPAETYADELGVTLSDEQAADMLGGRPLRTYHATRLLPHEVANVRRTGLRALTPALAEHRLDAAVGAGAITVEDSERFRAQTVFATGYGGVREGQVCSVVGTTAFDEDWRGVEPLLSTWGGEAIYMHTDDETRRGLKAVGRPAIVALDLPLGMAPWLIFPGLAIALAAHLARLPSRGADVLYRASVPASAVVAIWQPGAPEYDRFPNLPQA